MKYLSIFTFLITLKIWAQTPEWVKDPGQFCPAGSLCAVGEASGRMTSAGVARSEIAKIFAIQIDARSSYSTSSTTEYKHEVPMGDVSEETFSLVNESTNEILNGVEIKEQYSDEEAFYSLAVLNKLKAARLLKEKMEELDKSNNVLFNDGRRSSLVKIVKNLQTLKGLNHRYIVLGNTGFKPTLKYKEVLAKKREKQKEGKSVQLIINSDLSKNLLKSTFTKELVRSDFQVSKEKSATYKVVVKLTKNKEYFKVPGFVRYQFVLSTVAKQKSGEIIGSFNYKTVQTGRSMTQAFANARGGILKAINEKIPNLDLE